MSVFKPGYIYCITNQVNKKKYVGETMYPDTRWGQHKRNHTYPDRVKNKPLYQAMRKYGVDNFTFDIVAIYPSAIIALSMEDYWIDVFQSRAHQHGYNLKGGGKGSSEVSPETIEKMRKSKLGKKASELTRDRLSAAQRNAWMQRKLSVKDIVDDRNRIVISLHSAGLLNCEIAKKLEISQSVASVILKSLNLKSNGNVPGARKRSAPRGSSHYQGNRISSITSEVLSRKASGQGYDKICADLKCSPVTVRRILREAGVPKLEDQSKAKLPEIIYLRDSGLSWEKVSIRVGLSITTVINLYRQVKEDYEQRRSSGENHYRHISRERFSESVIQLREAGLTWTEVGSQLGFSADTAKRIYKQTMSTI